MPLRGSAHASRNEMAYAVHTATCTYLLDDDGVCRWIVSQQGIVPGHVRQCIGAQFVACIDVTIHGALVAELRVGGRALFVQQSGERMVLLRTGPIQHVDDRRVEQPDREAPPPAAAVREPGHGQYGKPAAPAQVAPPGVSLPAPLNPPSFGVVRYHGEEQTITIALSGRDAIDLDDPDMPTKVR